jgi:tRNA A-37 threonylcarbamoyl transferase component Bud32
VNAEDWISAARRAVSDAVRSIDGTDVEVILHHARLGSRHPWASFEVRNSGDVFWVAQMNGEAPAGTHVVPTELGAMGVWRHPNDPTLPRLRSAVTPGALADLLRDIAPDVDPQVVDVVTLEPLQRATVRVGHIGQAVYVKVLPPWRVATVASAHRRAVAGGVPSPPVLCVDAEQGWIVLGEILGRPLAEHLEDGLPLPEPDAVWMLVERMAEAVGAHGDLHDRQILVDESGDITGVVDFDDAGGDPLDDVAELIAHVVMRGITHPEQRARVDAYVAELVTSFAPRIDRDELERRIRVATARLEYRRVAFSTHNDPDRDPVHGTIEQ